MARLAFREDPAPSAAVAAGAQSVDVAALYATHAGAIRRLCLRLTRDPCAAEDLAQETFVRFIARLPNLPLDVNVGAYLQVTARNLYFKGLRDHTHEVCDEFLEERLGSDDDLDRDPARATLLVEQADQMRRSTARLNGRQRRAIVLREVEGCSYPEIAATMGISPDAVAHVLARARTRLRSEYRREQTPVPVAAAACEPIRDVLSTYLDGQVPTPVHDEVTAHLATCRDCREVLATYREASFQLRGAIPLSPLASLLERAGALLHVTVLQTTGTAATVAAGAAIVVAGGGGIVAAHHFAAPEPTIGAAAAAPDSTTTVARGGSSFRNVAIASDAAGAADGTDTGPVDTTASGDPTTTTPPGTTTDGGDTSVADALPLDADLPVSTPAITTPSVATPNVTTPDIAIPIATVPGVDVPPVTVPAVTVAPVALPTVSVPPVKLPKLPGG
jgi:trimeric autotransporter adhesin